MLNACTGTFSVFSIFPGCHLGALSGLIYVAIALGPVNIGIVKAHNGYDMRLFRVDLPFADVRSRAGAVRRVNDRTSLTAFCILDACATSYESNMLVVSRSP